MVAGRRAGDTVSLLEQGIQSIMDKAGKEGGNILISGFEGEKKKCKFDLVDKKQDDVVRWKVVFVREVFPGHYNDCPDAFEASGTYSAPRSSFSKVPSCNLITCIAVELKMSASPLAEAPLCVLACLEDGQRKQEIDCIDESKYPKSSTSVEQSH
ncbi:hypothetical protein llap_7521 [Limosa lapponica baueri]|uniref:Uncharacterized protein n=1 Tax=Limosa lapponica baueri TaxID=1758121 RepID=A0A2I0U7Z0_LIMLA|nr:hypothetical protein llap_7521 [Limosa lapponica baueri]